MSPPGMSDCHSFRRNRQNNSGQSTDNRRERYWQTVYPDRRINSYGFYDVRVNASIRRGEFHDRESNADTTDDNPIDVDNHIPENKTSEPLVTGNLSPAMESIESPSDDHPNLKPFATRDHVVQDADHFERSVFVGNVPSFAREKDLNRLLSPFGMYFTHQQTCCLVCIGLTQIGPIESIFIKDPRNARVSYAFVKFRYSSSARRSLSRERNLFIDNFILYVYLAPSYKALYNLTSIKIH
jgi:hypothetical protein